MAVVLLALVAVIAVGGLVLASGNNGLAAVQLATPTIDADAPAAAVVDLVWSVSNPVIVAPVGGTQVLSVIMQAGAQEVSAFALYIDFDPAIVSVSVPTQNGALFPSLLVNNRNNTTGRINSAAGYLIDPEDPEAPPNPSGTQTLITMTFTSKACGTTPLNFVFSAPDVRVTDLRLGEESVLRTANNNTIQVCDVVANTNTPSPTPTVTATSTNTDVPPTATATNTNTVVPPTATATNTNTVVPPTATATNTNTVVPPTATATATNTDVPPTASPTATNTDTPPTASPTATNTDVPPSASPTATNTDTPATATPTATNTDVPPTATPTATATSTDVVIATNTPTATATSTDVVIATNTPTATATSTDVVIATNTPTPTATNTDVPPTASPTATNTDVPPTATATATATDPGVVNTATPTPTLDPSITPTLTTVAPVSVPPTATPVPAAFVQCDNLGARTNGVITAAGSQGIVTAAVDTANRLKGAQIAGNVFCRLINLAGSYVTSAQEVGDSNVVQRGVRNAVDLFGLLPNGARGSFIYTRVMQVCFESAYGSTLLFADALGTPRMYFPLTTFTSGDYICAYIGRDGTVVQLEG